MRRCVDPRPPFDTRLRWGSGLGGPLVPRLVSRHTAGRELFLRGVAPPSVTYPCFADEPGQVIWFAGRARQIPWGGQDKVDPLMVT